MTRRLTLDPEYAARLASAAPGEVVEVRVGATAPEGVVQTGDEEHLEWRVERGLLIVRDSEYPEESEHVVEPPAAPGERVVVCEGHGTIHARVSTVEAEPWYYTLHLELPAR